MRRSGHRHAATVSAVQGSMFSQQYNSLTKALAVLRPGDVFVIWKMDRAFRSLRHALDVLEQLEKMNVDFVELTEGIDTTPPMGKCMYQVRGAFAELERNLISERTAASMAAAGRRGKKLGRPKALNAEQIDDARKKLKCSATLASLARLYQVNPRTLSRALQAGHI